MNLQYPRIASWAEYTVPGVFPLMLILASSLSRATVHTAPIPNVHCMIPPYSSVKDKNTNCDAGGLHGQV